MRRAQELGIPGRKCSVIYWGINVSDFSTETESLVHQPRERQRLITVARLAPEKGVDVALRALRQLRDMGYSLTYEVIGDGPENSRLEELAEFLGIEEYTNFRGWKSNDWVRGYLIRARDNCIYVQPSRREALSQAVLEAMAAGLPVITSNAGGLPEVVEDGATGLLFEVESVQGLVKVVETLLNDPDTANRLAQQGKKMVHGQFSDIVGAESFAALIKYL